MCRLLWLLPLVLLQACAGNPLAEQLERSFGAVETDPAAAVPADQGTDASTSGSTPTPAAETSKDTITRDGNANNSPQESSPKDSSPKDSLAKDSPSKASPSKDSSAEGKAKTQPAKTEPVKTEPATAQPPTAEKAPAPADDAGAKPVVKATQPLEPYRITIRLAGADPAAPAEAVTRALRQSDVTFSVERIERVTP